MNEVFLAVWCLEALWWWLHPASYRRRGSLLDWPLRAFFLVMFVSGAVVFVRGPVRILGAAAIGAAVSSWYRGAGRA